MPDFNDDMLDEDLAPKKGKGGFFDGESDEEEEGVGSDTDDDEEDDDADNASSDE